MARRAYTPLLIVCALLLLVPYVAAEIYTWTDKDGNVHFSDAPPVGAKSTVIPSVESRCSLRKYVVQFGEEVVQKYVNHFGGPYMSRDRGNIPPKHYGLFDSVIAEKDKCQKGDNVACKCVWNLADPGTKSFGPSGEAVADEPGKPVQKKTGPK